MLNSAFEQESASDFVYTYGNGKVSYANQPGCSKEPVYEITAPEFDEITIQLDPQYYSGKTFTVKAYNNSVNSSYIQKAELNGESLNECWF